MSKCKWCEIGSPEWSSDARVWVHRRSRLDKRCDANPLINAAIMADWGQVVANGGPPCFHLEDGGFCLRAKRWNGHGADSARMHPYVSLDQLLDATLAAKETV